MYGSFLDDLQASLHTVSYTHLDVYKRPSVFRTAGDIQYLYFQVFVYLREISGNMNLWGQWFHYQVAEVHGSQADSILGFSDT